MKREAMPYPSLEPSLQSPSTWGGAGLQRRVTSDKCGIGAQEGCRLSGGGEEGFPLAVGMAGDVDVVEEPVGEMGDAGVVEELVSVDEEKEMGLRSKGTGEGEVAPARVSWAGVTKEGVGPPPAPEAVGPPTPSPACPGGGQGKLAEASPVALLPAGGGATSAAIPTAASSVE